MICICFITILIASPLVIEFTLQGIAFSREFEKAIDFKRHEIGTRSVIFQKECARTY